MQPTTIRLPPEQLEQVDQLVADSEYFEDRSQALRYAIRQLLQREAEKDD